MRTLVIAILASLIALPLVGCNKKEQAAVPKEKSQSDFITVAEQKLDDLAARLERVKAQINGNEQAKAAVQQAADAAQAKIDAVRNTQLPALAEAKADAVDQAKAEINRSLQDAGDQVAKAEEALSAGGAFDQTKYAADARARLDQIQADLDELWAQADDASDEVQVRADTAGEGVEDALDEGFIALDIFETTEEAGDEDARNMRRQVEAAIERANAKMQELREALKQK